MQINKFLEIFFVNKTVSKLVSVLGYFWLFPVIYFFYTYGRFTVNAPFGDDIPLIIGRTVDFLQAPDIWSGLPFLFKQSEEYRVLFIALSGIISTEILGYINFSLIGLIGNTSLFVAVFITISLLSESRRELRVLAVIAFFLLASPVYMGCMFWTNCTIGHFGSIFFGAVACFFLARSGLISFLLFEITLLFALFNHGNGIGLVAIGFIGIWYCQFGSTRRTCFWLHSILSIMILIVGLMTFDSSAIDLIRAYTLNTIISSPLQSFVVTLKWFLAWVGSWASFSENITTALLAGIAELIVLVTIIFYCREKLLNRYAQIIFLIAFLLLTIGGASLLRAHLTVGIDHVFTDRFRVYSLVLLICVVCLMLVLIRDKKNGILYREGIWNLTAMILMLAGGIYFYKTNYDYQPKFIAHKTQQLKCSSEWEQDGIAKPCTWHGDNKMIMDRAVEAGILHINKNGTEPLRCERPYLKYCWK